MREWSNRELHAIGEKRPRSPKWSRNYELERAVIKTNGMAFGTSAYSVGRIRVASQLIIAELPTGDGVGPQWIVSISRGGRRRPTNGECRRLLRHLGIGDAEEDNHENGIARKFWYPLDPSQRVDCQCKADEEQVVEPDGYTWSRKREVPA